MYLRSMYPPIPSLPPTNYHNLVFRMPEQQAFADHVIHIDAVTGKQRTRYEFIERVYDAATAIGADRSFGGLGLGQDHMVGILSDNCLVCRRISLLVSSSSDMCFRNISRFCTPW
jgi:hypothetical protein